MPATWPASLPQVPNARGYSEAPPDSTIRTSMGYGPDKVRRRTTANARVFVAPLIVNKTQVATLDAFYLDTLGGGVDEFDWVNPRTGSAATLRFQASPQYTNIGADEYSVTLSLEELP